MDTPPREGTIGVVYAVHNAASRLDAEAIRVAIGNGVKVGNALLPARVVADDEFAAGHFVVAIAAVGANSATLGGVVRMARILCVTADMAAVQAGFCTMGINTDVRVDIVLNHEAAAASGIVFAAAFRMMVREF